MPTRKDSSPSKAGGPKPGRPKMPASYRIKKNASGLLRWSDACRKIAGSHNYWVATTRSDGRPHVMPVWGVWTNETFYFGTDRNSRKARNLSANSAIVIHLESGDDVVILEGQAEEILERAVFQSIDDAYLSKYRMRLSTIPGDTVIFGLKPRTVFAWREHDFNRSATRWRLDPLVSPPSRPTTAPQIKKPAKGKRARTR